MSEEVPRAPRAANLTEVAMSKIVIMLVLVVVCIAGLAAFDSMSNLNAEETVSAGLSSKLNKVISNQEKILQKLDDMAKQIQIVKIRATR